MNPKNIPIYELWTIMAWLMSERQKAQEVWDFRASLIM